MNNKAIPLYHCHDGLADDAIPISVCGEKIDAYIRKNSEANVSHSICPECMKMHYPEINIELPND
jgi:hypothetical protein